MSNEDYCFAKWGWQAKDVGEVTFEKGEYLKVVERNGEWWRGVFTDGRNGWFPALRVRPLTGASEIAQLQAGLSQYEASHGPFDAKSGGGGGGGGGGEVDSALMSDLEALVEDSRKSKDKEHKEKKKDKKAKDAPAPAQQQSSAGAAAAEALASPRGGEVDGVMYVRAKWGWQAKAPTELNMNKGDLLRVTKQQGEWWKGRTKDGQHGWFPAARVVAVDAEPGNAEQRALDAAFDAATKGSGAAKPAGLARAASASGREPAAPAQSANEGAAVDVAAGHDSYVRAKWGWQPRAEGELAFDKGAEIRVSQKKDEWWKGRTTEGVSGWFPKDRVRPVTEPERIKALDAIFKALSAEKKTAKRSKSIRDEDAVMAAAAAAASNRSGPGRPPTPPTEPGEFSAIIPKAPRGGTVAPLPPPPPLDDDDELPPPVPTLVADFASTSRPAEPLDSILDDLEDLERKKPQPAQQAPAAREAAAAQRPVDDNLDMSALDDLLVGLNPRNASKQFGTFEADEAVADVVRNTAVERKDEREAAAQRERDAAAQRERDAAAQRERDAAAQRERDAAAQRERDAAAQRERDAAAQREREAASQRQAAASAEAAAREQRERERREKEEKQIREQREAEKAQQAARAAQLQRERDEAEAEKRRVEAEKQRAIEEARLERERAAAEAESLRKEREKLAKEREAREKADREREARLAADREAELVRARLRAEMEEEEREVEQRRARLRKEAEELEAEKARLATEKRAREEEAAREQARQAAERERRAADERRAAEERRVAEERERADREREKREREERERRQAQADKEARERRERLDKLRAEEEAERERIQREKAALAAEREQLERERRDRERASAVASTATRTYASNTSAPTASRSVATSEVASSNKDGLDTSDLDALLGDLDSFKPSAATSTTTTSSTTTTTYNSRPTNEAASYNQKKGTVDRMDFGEDLARGDSAEYARSRAYEASTTTSYSQPPMRTSRSTTTTPAGAYSTPATTVAAAPPFLQSSTSLESVAAEGGHRVTLTGLERDVLSLLRRLRSDPQYFVDLIERSRLPYFEGESMLLTSPVDGSRLRFITAEGRAAADDAVRELRRIASGLPLPEPKLSAGMTLAAKQGLPDNSSFGTIRQFGRFEGKIVECCAFDQHTAEDILLQLLIDDGDESRTKRKMLLDRQFQHVGVAADSQKCIINLAFRFIDK